MYVRMALVCVRLHPVVDVEGGVALPHRILRRVHVGRAQLREQVFAPLLEPLVLGQLVEQADHDALPAAVLEVAFPELLDPVVVFEHVLGAVPDLGLRVLALLLGSPRLREQPLGLGLSEAASRGPRRGTVRLRGRLLGLLLFLVGLLVRVLFVVQLGQLHVHLAAVRLAADDLLEHRTVDLFKQLHRRVRGRDAHGLDEVVKREGVELEDLAVHVQRVPRLQERADRLHRHLVADAGAAVNGGDIFGGGRGSRQRNAKGGLTMPSLNGTWRSSMGYLGSGGGGGGSGAVMECGSGWFRKLSGSWKGFLWGGAWKMPVSAFPSMPGDPFWPCGNSGDWCLPFWFLGAGFSSGSRAGPFCCMAPLTPLAPPWASCAAVVVVVVVVVGVWLARFCACSCFRSISLVRRDARVDVVLRGDVVLHEPRRAVPGLARHRLLDERPQDRLGEDLAVAEDVVVVDDGLDAGPVVEADRVPRVGGGLRAVGQHLAAEPRLFPHDSLQPFALGRADGDGLAGVVVGPELVKDEVDERIDSGYRLELDATQDGALEGFGEGLLDLFGAGELRWD
ncbi:hypothetical protein ColKHC_03901 [Colletotrichum higginsianum]|nr:hypothetical protein ColKHC_03901 [Colletotrichum higginsianum]